MSVDGEHSAHDGEQAPQQAVLLCGAETVRCFAAGAAPSEPLWQWSAASDPSVAEADRRALAITDECKPRAEEVLVSSSGGAAALVDRRSARASLVVRVRNAHSIDVLPEGRVAVAGSHADDGNGDCIAVFDRSDGTRRLISEELPGGHGLFWDADEGLLWALGSTQLRAYRLAEWQSAEPRLELRSRYELPAYGGHDLSVQPASGALLITCNPGCWCFDRGTERFEPHPRFGAEQQVKSISYAPDGRIVWVQAEQPDWWSQELHFAEPEGNWRFPGERLYKARWAGRCDDWLTG